MSPFKNLPQAASRLASQKLCVLGLLILACVFAYAPALNGEFLWDDLYLVGQNPFFKSPAFGLEVFRHYLYLDSLSLYYRPVQNLSYIIDYWAWNQNPLGYHLSNILLHAACGYVLYLLLRRILPSLLRGEEGEPARDSAVAFLVSLVWVIHPIHNAAVAYIAGRADSLATLFAVGGWLLYSRYESGARRVACYLIAPLLFLLAMGSKEIAFIWIALFGIYLFAFDKKQTPRAKLTIAGSLLVAFVCYMGLRHLPEARAAQSSAGAELLTTRVLLMLRALGDYASLIFFPSKLHMERIVSTSVEYRSFDLWEKAIRFEYLSLLGLTVLAGFGYAAWSKLPGQRLRIFGIVWFMLGFLPISNLFPLNAQIAEHWIYMASFGFLLLIGGCVVALPKRFYPVAAALVSAGVLALGVRTSFRAQEWADPEVFFKQTIAAGGSSARVNLNLAHVYSNRGEHVKAEQVLRETIQRFPDYPNARINLGINLLKQGRAQEAEPFLKFNKAASDEMAGLYPHTWSAALNIAHMRYNEGKTSEALSVIGNAVSSYPEIWELVQFQAQIVEHASGAAAAAPAVEKYALGHWWHYESHMMLGQLRCSDGDFSGALNAFNLANRLDIHATEPYQMIARVSLMNNQPARALEAQQKSIGRGSGQPSQYLFLASILEQMNRKGEAEIAVKKAENLRDSVKLHVKYL